VSECLALFWVKWSPNDSSHLSLIIAEWPQEPMCGKNNTENLLTKHFGKLSEWLHAPIRSAMRLQICNVLDCVVSIPTKFTTTMSGCVVSGCSAILSMFEQVALWLIGCYWWFPKSCYAIN